MDIVNEVEIRRFKYDARRTWGRLYINGKFLCFTLEDTLRPWGIKVPGETGIPAGTYRIKLTMSGKFKRLLPIIFTEDNGYQIRKAGTEWKGVRLHRGNSIKDTWGCPLVGYTLLAMGVGNSTKAEQDLVTALVGQGEVPLTITNLKPEDD